MRLAHVKVVKMVISDYTMKVFCGTWVSLGLKTFKIEINTFKWAMYMYEGLDDWLFGTVVKVRCFVQALITGCRIFTLLINVDQLLVNCCSFLFRMFLDSHINFLFIIAQSVHCSKKRSISAVASFWFVIRAGLFIMVFFNMHFSVISHSTSK